jgi:hypothetical protein
LLDLFRCHCSSLRYVYVCVFSLGYKHITSETQVYQVNSAR